MSRIHASSSTHQIIFIPPCVTPLYSKLPILQYLLHGRQYVQDIWQSLKYQEQIHPLQGSLLRKKLPAIKAKNDYERNGKLIRFAASHGYNMDEILQCLKRIGCEDDYFD